MLYCNLLLQSLRRTNANDVLFIPQREPMSGKRLERKIPLGKAMNSSIKNNILIDEFHGNALPFNIFIKLYIYTTKAFLPSGYSWIEAISIF